MVKKVAILISGSGSNMETLVNAMQSDADFGAVPVLVLANRPDAGGLEKARILGVPTEVVDHRPFGQDRDAFENALQNVISSYEPDILCLAGFMRILTASFISQWTDRMLNIHPSLLPKYKGLNTHQRALDAGDDTAGCSVHIVTPELDDGPILGQARVPVLEGDTADTLAKRVLIEEHKLYPQVLREFVKS